MSAGKYRKEHNCLNCGHYVEEHYCSRCGQANLELKESFWHFLSHSIAHYFHFDSKFIKTVKPLLFKPGFMTLEYLQGKRARYINPVNLYIFVSIVYFLAMGIINSHDEEKNAKFDNAIQKSVLDTLPIKFKIIGTKDNLSTELTDVLKFDSVKRHFQHLSYQNQEVFLADLRSNSKDTSASGREMIALLEHEHVLKGDSTYSAYLKRQAKLPAGDRDNIVDRFLKRRSINFNKYGHQIQEKLEHNRPKQYFLFMPLMALFVMLNFRKNHFYYLDHLIFTIHGMTAFFVVQIFTKPIGYFIFGEESLTTSIINWVVGLWIIWYMYMALRTFYRRKRSVTIWRMLWIFTLYAICLSLSEDILRNIIYYTTL